MGLWYQGNLSIFGLSLAKEGFAFVNFNYQLAPEVEFPGELDDVNRAVHWVASHGSDYDIDLNNISSSVTVLADKWRCSI